MINLKDIKYRSCRPITLNTFYTKKTLVIIIFLNICGSMYSQSACIIVHGTWAKDESWYKPCGDFFESVKACNDELKIVDKVISFSWSGKLGYNAQLLAAQKLSNLIKKYNFVILICHSHGATIGIIASEIIFKTYTNRNNVGRIEKFYALGAPVDTTTINPNMTTIKKFYNLFSFGDFIQTINGAYKRIFLQQENLVNISVQLNFQHPTHTELHHPSIGLWLLKIDDFFKNHEIGNFKNFCFSVPGVINFISYSHPIYSEQNDQDYLLELDKKIHELTRVTLFRSKKFAHDNDSKRS